MTKKQALALLRKKRKPGRPTKAESKKLAQARKLVNLTTKARKNLKSMTPKKAKSLLAQKRKQGRPAAVTGAKLAKARKVLGRNPCVCGDIFCASCGPAQGNIRCVYCGYWTEEGGCPDKEYCDNLKHEDQLREEAIEFQRNPKMKLLTKEILKKLPPLRATENLSNRQKKVIVKFFNPGGNGTWYALEYDPKERLFFGYVDLMEKELGYFSLDELEAFRGRFGLGIERDAWWDSNTSLEDVIEGRAR